MFDSVGSAHKLLVGRWDLEAIRLCGSIRKGGSELGMHCDDGNNIEISSARYVGKARQAISNIRCKAMSAIRAADDVLQPVKS